MNTLERGQAGAMTLVPGSISIKQEAGKVGCLRMKNEFTENLKKQLSENKNIGNF